MSESCSDNCQTCGKTCAERREPQSMQAAPNPRSNIKNVIGVVSGKGGVGKSLVTSLIASALAKQGKNVGILDARHHRPFHSSYVRYRRQGDGISRWLTSCGGSRWHEGHVDQSVA